MITWLKINFGQWPDHVDRPNKFYRCHVSTFLTGQNKENLDNLQAQNYQLLGLVIAEPFKVVEHSFGSLWVYFISRLEKYCSSQAETWLVKKYTDERVWLTGQVWRFRNFHGNMNDWIQPMTCLPPRSVQSTDRNKRKIMQLCLWHVWMYRSQLKMGMISQHSITGTFLSQPFVFARAFHNDFF